MITILALIGGLLIGLFLGAWACIIGIGDISAYNHKCWVQWDQVNKDEVEDE